MRKRTTNAATLLSILIVTAQGIYSLMASTSKPIVIAHRGASGYLPEHTLAAYALAHAQGADYIEQDLVLTRDRHLICLHDLHLEGTTNVEELFPNRRRADGRWYAIDFSLAEIKTLSVHERLSNRFPTHSSGGSIPTFIEAFQLVQGLNATTGRNAGIYPELKRPAFHRQAGLAMEKPFMDALALLELNTEKARVFVQCFELDCLQRLHKDYKIRLPLIYLVGSGAEIVASLTPEKLTALAAFLHGIGPSKNLIELHPGIVGDSHHAGLELHPYTFRADDPYPRGQFKDFHAEVTHFVRVHQIDGLFTDFPDLAREAIDASSE